MFSARSAAEKPQLYYLYVKSVDAAGTESAWSEGFGFYVGIAAPTEKDAELIISQCFSGEVGGKTYEDIQGFKFVFKKVNSTTSNVNGTSLRLYANDIMTISGKKITKIVVTCDSSTYTQLTAENGKLSTSGTTQTWTPADGTEYAESVAFTASKQSRFSKIVITYLE